VLATRIRNRHLLALDVVAALFAPIFALIARFEGFAWIEAPMGVTVAAYVIVTLPARILTFYVAGLYGRLWRQASVGELKRVLLASAVQTVWCALAGLLVVPLVFGVRVPFSVVFMDAFVCATLITLPRLWLRVHRPLGLKRRRDDTGRRVLIVGAGDTAKMVAKELSASHTLGMTPVGFVDDDKRKHGQSLCDLPVLGSITDIRDLVITHSIAELVIAMPSAHGNVVRQVVRAALDSGIPTLTVPSFPELVARRAGGMSLRDVEIQDLLRRDPVETDLAAVAALATHETVLITGAGGSIGSELCRQIARLAPARIVLLGHGENSIFDILEELTRDYGDIECIPTIADIRDGRRVMEVFQQYRPRTVFHAAAHKHVPLMEHNVVEAVTNNVIGTRNVVAGAVESGVEHFVLISTDKAVRPTSVMGATKRVAEQIVQHAAMKHGRKFVSVRFGNVLGSRGSVVPTFMRQIRAGGPVTVTHPEMRRFFMTIPEAVQLVLQAGALGHGGEVFALDMGEPVRLVDLATDLIRLSGLEVGTDVKIKFTGVRPGEKLYEEMFFAGEDVVPTEHSKILRARGGALAEGTMRRIDALVQTADRGMIPEEIRASLRELVPDFHTPAGVPMEASPRLTPVPAGLRELPAGNRLS
jgi:FlaA1/EpsC-like NDP-sugar epimerase